MPDRAALDNERIKDFLDLKWAHDRWEPANDAPFVKAKAEINKELAHSANPIAVASKYRALAAEHPKDALAQFRWAYASYDPALLTPHEEFGEPMARAEQPHSYEYTRLLFLMEATASQTRFIGLRLLNKNPKDDLVKAKIVAVSIWRLSDRVPGMKEQLLKWSYELINKYPDRMEYRRFPSDIYGEYWWVTKSVAAAKLAIVYNEDYLRSIPKDGRELGEVEFIHIVKKWLANQPKGKR